MIRNSLTSYIFNIIRNFKFRLGGVKTSNRVRIINSSFEGKNFIGERTIIKNTNLGLFSYVSFESFIQNSEVGRFCSIGPGCKIGLGIHPLSHLSTHPALYSDKPPMGDSICLDRSFNEYETVVVEHDVWIGANSTIVDGVTIGCGAVICAGAVVTKNVEPYSVVGGVPAKHIKYRFDRATVNTLIKSKWWYLSEDEIVMFNNDFMKSSTLK
ncbi:CatB-related O-acetyltransferase [Vibrio astriarenae]